MLHSLLSPLFISITFVALICSVASARIQLGMPYHAPVEAALAVTNTPTRTPTPINVGNFVWDDLNGNGVQNAGEPGLANVTVQLWNAAKTQLFSSTVTNSSGVYTLIAPTPGQYRVRVVLPHVLDQFSPKDLGGDDLLDLLISRQVRMIRGNWDEIFIDLQGYLARLPASAHPFVLKNYEWLLRNVSSAAQRMLATLPLSDQLEVAPGQRLFVCHAAPGDPWSRACGADAATATLRALYGAVPSQVIAYGHYHAHHIIQLDQQLLLNVASVGMKRGAQSAFTMLDYTDGRWNVQQYQAPYDPDLLAQLTRERGVPRPD